MSAKLAKLRLRFLDCERFHGASLASGVWPNKPAHTTVCDLKSASATKQSVEPPWVNHIKNHSSSEGAREIRANSVVLTYLYRMRDRLSRERRSTFPRPSDGRGARVEGKDRLSRERRSRNMSRFRKRCQKVKRCKKVS